MDDLDQLSDISLVALEVFGFGVLYFVLIFVAFTLDRARKQNPTKVSRFEFGTRLAVAIIVFGLGWYGMVLVRTMDIGWNGLIGTLCLGLVIVTPAALIPFLGLGRRQLVRFTSILVIACMFSTEAYAWAEEIYVIYFKNHNDQETIYHSRWWPSGNHDILYTPENGWWGGD